MKALYLIFLFVLINAHAFATHLLGGTMSYSYLGNNSYQVTLTVYRDCHAIAPFDYPAAVGVFKSNGSLVTQIDLFPIAGSYPASTNDTCYNSTGLYCIDKATYTGNTYLVPVAGGYTLSYQRCCRPGNVGNFVNSSAVGFTISCYIPEAPASANSSPYFNNDFPLYVCAGMPLSFDHSATDADGDSLVYELCTAIDGASAANPQPVPPAAPPYATVPYATPYSATYPLHAWPALSLAPNSGMLTGSPWVPGTWTISVCVNEYRNGTLLSTVRRETFMIVADCQNTAASVLSHVSGNCGYTVDFTHPYDSTGTFLWDFGIPSSQTDTSTLTTPSFTFPAYGSYNVTLILEPNTPCADTATQVFIVDSCTTQSIHDIVKRHGLKVFPNPSSGSFTIEADETLSAPVLVEIINAHGRVASRKWYSSSANTFLVEENGLPAGLYTVRITYNDRIRTGRVIITGK